MSRLKITKPKERRRLKRRNRKTLIAIAIFLTPLIIISGFMWYNISAIGSPGKKVTIEIVPDHPRIKLQKFSKKMGL